MIEASIYLIPTMAWYEVFLGIGAEKVGSWIPSGVCSRVTAEDTWTRILVSAGIKSQAKSLGRAVQEAKQAVD